MGAAVLASSERKEKSSRWRGDGGQAARLSGPPEPRSGPLWGHRRFGAGEEQEAGSHAGAWKGFHGGLGWGVNRMEVQKKPLPAVVPPTHPRGPLSLALCDMIGEPGPK